MPLYVIRRFLCGQDEFVSKSGAWDADYKRARIFANMGAVKNSITHWRGMGDGDAEIVELELQPTGKVITVEDAMAPLKERRLKLVLERRAREEQSRRDRELTELKRLQEKYIDTGSKA